MSPVSTWWKISMSPAQSDKARRRWSESRTG